MARGRSGIAAFGDRQHLVHGDAQGINVAPCVRKTAPGLLRRAVMDRPHDVGIDRVAGRRPRDAEVRHLRGSVRGDNDVLRFYVPVDNAIVMRSLKSGRNLQRNAHGFPDGQSSPVLDIQLQRDALYQLHHDKVVPVFLADVEYIDDIRVRQTGRGLGSYAIDYLISVL